jgi:MFS family permease
MTASPASPDLTAPGTRRDLQRRTLRVLVITQMLSGVGLAAGVTVGALLAEDMLGSTRLSGLPAALFTTGAATAALLVGRISQRAGRRVGLASGYAAGTLGAAAVVLAAALDNIPLLLGGLLVYGAGIATNLQARYAGADLADWDARGRAISLVLVATTAGAVAGPTLVDVTGGFAEQLEIPRLAGPFLLAFVGYGAAALMLQLFLRPDPLLVARTSKGPLLPAEREKGPSAGAGPGGDMMLAVTAMVLAQIVMVAIMTMTPVHMRDHGHGLTATGIVIGTHIAFMYLPSPLTGMLADRIGRRPVIAAGGVVLVASGLLAAVASPDSMALLMLALGLLGLGWNLGLIGGTVLLTDSTPVATRARTQGNVDLGVALAGAGGGLSSGIVVAGASYAVLGVVGAVLALLLVPALLRSARKPAPATT